MKNIRVWLSKNIPYSIKHPIQALKRKKIIAKKFNAAIQSDLNHFSSSSDFKIWKSAFAKYSCTGANYYELLVNFTDSKISKISSKKTPGVGKVILITVMKNEITRVKNFLDYYRKIGIEHFVILDNHSSDGTKEFLCHQDDCDLYFTDERYSTIKREAWINRLISYYGFSRWYMVVDSDEHFTYPNIECLKINQFIECMEKKDVKRVRSIMLDMYPRANINAIRDKELDYITEYVYFDNKESYTINIRDVGVVVTGGPRERLFNIKVYLTKYPLFFFEKGDLQVHSHYQFPYNKNRTPCYSALLHYKFLGTDIDKYKQRLREKSFYNGSKEYERYLQLFGDEEKELSFYSQDISVRYTDSKSLLIAGVVNDFS